jgi:hypothetical protein
MGGLVWKPLSSSSFILKKKLFCRACPGKLHRLGWRQKREGMHGLHMCCVTSEPLKGPYILSILEQETRITVEQVPCQWDALPILS